MKFNISVTKYKKTKQIFLWSYFISFLILLILILVIPTMRSEWLSYVMVVLGSLIVPLILISTYHLKYYKKKI